MERERMTGVCVCVCECVCVCVCVCFGGAQKRDESGLFVHLSPTSPEPVAGTCLATAKFLKSDFSQKAVIKK